MVCERPGFCNCSEIRALRVTLQLSDEKIYDHAMPRIAAHSTAKVVGFQCKNDQADCTLWNSVQQRLVLKGLLPQELQDERRVCSRGSPTPSSPVVSPPDLVGVIQCLFCRREFAQMHQRLGSGKSTLLNHHLDLKTVCGPSWHLRRTVRSLAIALSKRCANLQLDDAGASSETMNNFYGVGNHLVQP